MHRLRKCKVGGWHDTRGKKLSRRRQFWALESRLRVAIVSLILVQGDLRPKDSLPKMITMHRDAAREENSLGMSLRKGTVIFTTNALRYDVGFRTSSIDHWMVKGKKKNFRVPGWPWQRSNVFCKDRVTDNGIGKVKNTARKYIPRVFVNHT